MNRNCFIGPGVGRRSLKAFQARFESCMEHKNLTSMEYEDEYVEQDWSIDSASKHTERIKSKDHMVQCTINVSANDYDKIKEKLSSIENGNKYFDELETKREIATMKEVLKMPGRSMIEKVNNAINAWDDEKQITRRTDNNRYKLKYKY